MLDANKIARYAATTGTPLCDTLGAVNIVYIEGMDPNSKPNKDLPNRWNDLRLLLTHDGTSWQIVHNGIATTEPGDYYTKNPMKPQGCARIAFGYHPPAWAEGLHKGQPALVQRARVKIHRDYNRDGLRNRSELAEWAGVESGINQHSTSETFKGWSVGKFSAGCMVEWLWAMHMRFLKWLRSDVRRIRIEEMGGVYLHDCWVLAGDKFNEFK